MQINRERKLTETLSQAEVKPGFHTSMNVPPGCEIFNAASVRQLAQGSLIPVLLEKELLNGLINNF